VWKAKDEKLYRLKIVKDQNEMTITGKISLFCMFLFDYMQYPLQNQNQLLNRMCIVLK